MLRLDAVHLSFADGPVLDGVSLAVPSGALVALLGRSGCGKTTLLNLAAGTHRPTSGRIDSGFSRTAMVFQEPRLMPWADAVDNAAFGLKAMGLPRAERRALAAEILARLGFAPADLGKRPRALSGGMQQRVAIARALAVGPDLLLMDEPFSALDVGLRAELQTLVREEVERSGIAVLFVTHDVTEAVRLADRIVVLSPRPARVVADLVNGPQAGASEIFAAAAHLLAQDEVAAALAPPDGGARAARVAAPREARPREEPPPREPRLPEQSRVPARAGRPDALAELARGPRPR